jgi:flagellar biosynthesis/type III secretory pathway M-ring protein FliF/YscJ
METMLSIVMLAMFALVIGAIVLWRRGGPRRQIALMLVLAAVMAANIAILTWPDAKGETPLAHELK